ncbi:MAG: sensor N-terminal transmembrane domain-containing protein, partial [Ignavibacteriales bacterium]
MASAIATAKPERPERLPGGGSLFGSRLGRLIIALNLLGLAILISGAVVLNELRRGLVNARIDSLTTQGELIANVIDRAATVGEPEP